jgi:hypothetical protein
MREPIKHDHVGWMAYGFKRCVCHGCGQVWVLTTSPNGFTRWVPV